MAINGTPHPCPSQGLGECFVAPILVEGSDIFFNRLSVIIEDKQYVISAASGIVEGLEDHAAGKGAIAHHRDAATRDPLEDIRAGKAQQGG